MVTEFLKKRTAEWDFSQKDYVARVYALSILMKLNPSVKEHVKFCESIMFDWIEEYLLEHEEAKRPVCQITHDKRSSVSMFFL